MARVELRQVSKTFAGGVEAVIGVSLSIADGEFLVVVGPSGSGKSTLLRMIAGLESVDSGEISIDGRRADRLAPRERDVAMVFQEPTLYPHLSVFENLAFGLRARKVPDTEVRARVESVASLLGVADQLKRMPETLSGGQKQRVALGRAIARRPAILLLDEPLSSLDAPLRSSIRADLVELHRRLGTTMIHVTHDQEEALALGDRIAVMDGGRLVQVGPPVEVYDRPATRFVGGFIGGPPMNFLPCVAFMESEGVRLGIAEGDREPAWFLPTGTPGLAPLLSRGSGPILLGIRPEDLAIGAGESETVAGVVTRLEPSGHETRATIAVGPHILNIRLSTPPRVVVGDVVRIRPDIERARWFDPDTSEILR